MKVSKFHYSTGVAVMLLCLSDCRPEQRPQPEPEYNVLTVQPSDQEIATSYSASIKGRQDIDILPQVGGFLTNFLCSSLYSKTCRKNCAETRL